MQNLKSLLGDSYHEGITLEEINAFLEGKKFVDLKTGQYVDKQKYDSLRQEHEELKSRTTNYETISQELETLKAQNADRELRDILVGLGISDKAIKYVKSDLEDGTLIRSEDPKEFAKSVKEYLKVNPQFAITPAPVKQTKFISTHTEPVDNGQTQNNNQLVNNAIRLSAGRKIITDGE